MPFTFFVFAWHWKTDLNFAFCFSFSLNFEKRIWTSYFFFVFASLWKTDMNFSFRFSFLHCLLLKNRLEFGLSILHEFEKWINTPVIWNSPLPLPKGMTGIYNEGPFTSQSLHFYSPVGGGYAWNPGVYLPDREGQYRQRSHSVVSVSIFAPRSNFAYIFIASRSWRNTCMFCKVSLDAAYIRHVLNKTQTVPFIRAYKECLSWVPFSLNLEHIFCTPYWRS